MTDAGSLGPSTTHDWSARVDIEHLAHIRRHPSVFAPTGVRHLVLEVLAYAAEEAAEQSDQRGPCVVVIHPDASFSVSDNGRGTDTRVDPVGRTVRKPIMGTKDLRYFDTPISPLLPDGHPRRGMSVVAALSDWLIHTNRRENGSWTQRYEHGVPVTDLIAIPDNGSTGTVVRFLPEPDLRNPALRTGRLQVEVARWTHLSIEFVNQLDRGPP